MRQSPETATITLAARIARLCDNQCVLARATDRLGTALAAHDWLAAEALANGVVELGNDIGFDAYMVDKTERALKALGTS